MENFWENSPEWQRERELFAELEAVSAARREAGEQVLYCIAADADSPHGDYWRQHRQAFKDADESYSEAFLTWRAARKAFEASPVGQAYHRWLKDPLAPAAPAEQEAA